MQQTFYIICPHCAAAWFEELPVLESRRICVPRVKSGPIKAGEGCAYCPRAHRFEVVPEADALTLEGYYDLAYQRRGTPVLPASGEEVVGKPPHQQPKLYDLGMKRVF